MGLKAIPGFGSSLMDNIQAFVLNFINIFSISSGYGADGILIPKLHKELPVAFYTLKNFDGKNIIN